MRFLEGLLSGRRRPTANRVERGCNRVLAGSNPAPSADWLKLARVTFYAVLIVMFALFKGLGWETGLCAVFCAASYWFFTWATAP